MFGAYLSFFFAFISSIFQIFIYFQFLIFNYYYLCQKNVCN